jgi:hypothetical protein
VIDNEHNIIEAASRYVDTPIFVGNDYCPFFSGMATSFGASTKSHMFAAESYHPGKWAS